MSSNYLTADNGVSSGVTGITQSAGNDGTLQIRTTTSGGSATTAVTIDNTQKVTFANSIGFGSNAGITFNNSSALTNSTLNDYETGTWTPTDGSGASLSLTVNSASYTKIGRLVYAWCYVTYPVTASSATTTIAGFPFTQSPASTYAHGTARSNGVSTLMQIQMNSSRTDAIFFTAGGVNATNANISNNYLVFSIVYQATF
jgi:hypothetical protein